MKINDNKYLFWIKNELKQHNVRVHRWGEFNNDDDEIYYAYFNSRRVYIPIPKCDHSFLISLHELGHIVTGNDFYGHIAEYNAERWAINLAKKKYKIKNEEYEESAKDYVYEHLIEDIACRFFNYKLLDPKIKRWINVNKKDLFEDVNNFSIENKNKYV